MTTHVHTDPLTERPGRSDPAPLGGTRWNTWDEGVTLTPQRFVDESAVLLQGVLAATVDVDPGLLVEQLRNTFSLDARESSFPLRTSPNAAPVTRQLAAQAERIGDGIRARAQRSLERVLAEPVALPEGPLAVRSHCDGHEWTPPVARMLTGPQGGPAAMQLFNEWLHHMVLLRDALLPFANWAEVPLAVSSDGLRRLEPARERFLAEALFRQVRHTSIVDYARRVVTDTSGPAGYGFDCALGTALPEAVRGPLGASSSYLLAWHPAEAGTGASDVPVPGVSTYVYETEDYYAAARTPLESLPAAGQDAAGHASGAPLTARIVTDPAVGSTKTARIGLTRGSETATADLGQALRGHRFSYRQPSGRAPGTESVPAAPRRRVEAWSVLSAPGLAWAQNGDWFVDAAAVDDLVRLALLGKLYPENVVLQREADRGTTVTVGKDGPARILVVVAD